MNKLTHKDLTKHDIIIHVPQSNPYENGFMVIQKKDVQHYALIAYNDKSGMLCCLAGPDESEYNHKILWYNRTGELKERLRVTGTSPASYKSWQKFYKMVEEL